MTFKELAKKVLEETSAAMSADEIWKFAVVKNYDKELESVGLTPSATLGAQLYTDIKRENSLFTGIGVRPVKFAIKSANNQTLQQYTQPVIKNKTPDIPLERDLHKILVEFLFNTENIYLKTIFHEKSKSNGKNHNEWIHPDIVGVKFSFQTYSKNCIDIIKQTSKSLMELYSFELKRQISFSNLRECFFQTVSNSSWSNYGYMVAADFDSSLEFMDELQRLSNSFGIGIIKLNVQNPNESQILFQSKFKDRLDFEMIDKLAILNPDFQKFLNDIDGTCKISKINSADYDKTDN